MTSLDVNEVQLCDEISALMLAYTETGLVTRNGRPCYATLEVWKPLERTLGTTGYISAMVGRQRTELLFGAVPFVNTSGQPDMIQAFLDLMKRSTVRIDNGVLVVDA